VRQWLLAGAIAASARAKHLLLAAATAAIDTGIASLQRLRQRAGGAEDPDERRDHDRKRPGKRATMERPGDKPAAEEPVVPKPRRRLRSLLVHLSVMLAGGMGGMVLAYDLLAQLLDHRSAEIKRQEIKMSKYSKSVAALEKKLGQQQVKQTETETRLAATLAENEKKLGELQTKRAEAETRLASALAGRVSDLRRQEDTGGSGGAARSGQAGWARAGNCTVGSGDVRSVLTGCIAGLDRK